MLINLYQLRVSCWLDCNPNTNNNPNHNPKPKTNPKEGKKGNASTQMCVWNLFWSGRYFMARATGWSEKYLCM